MVHNCMRPDFLAVSRQKKEMARVEWLLALLVSAAAFVVHGQPGDTMTPTKCMMEGQTLISSGGTFELGFFSPGGSENRYLGIYFRATRDRRVVWVANRVSPLNGSTGVLNLSADGNLVLLNSTGCILWSTGTSNAINPLVQLLDSGNLVVIEGTSNDTLWQSFDHPSDTLLPDMMLRMDLRTNLESHLTSWKRSTDPSPGDYRSYIHRAKPELLLRKGPDLLYRTGHWNGNGFSGLPEMKTNHLFRFKLTSNDDEIVYSFEVLDRSVLSCLVVNETGHVQRLVWSESSQEWAPYWWIPKDSCDEYASCGANGVCNTNYSPDCDCLRGFRPKSPQKWRMRDNSDGCERRTALNCPGGDGFFEMQQVKLPDASNVTVHSNKSLEECKDWCLKNCTCSAYAIIEGNGCVTWTGDLVDIRLFTEGGENLFVRLASSELGNEYVLRGEGKGMI